MNSEQKPKRELKPRLRFPEFQDAGEWEKKQLLEVCDINPSNEDLPESFIYIDLESVDAGKLIHKRKINRDGAPSRAQRLLKDGDVIYQIVRPYQRNNFFCNFDDANSYVASTGYAQLRSLGERKFLYQLIHTDNFVNKVIAKCTGSNYPAINSSSLAEINVTIPQFPEQQKIADCLSSLDELITAQSQKLDTLKVHKKGLMQQLFPREGETVPRLRFPEFREVGEWDVEILGDLSTVVRGGSPRPIDGFLTTAANGLNWLKIGDVDKEAKYVTKTQEKIRSEALSKTREVHPGDLILSNSMSFGRPYLMKIKSCIHDGWIAIIELLEQVSREYLYYLIFAPTSQSYFLNNAAGSGVLNLNAEIIRALPVAYPSLPEQQRVADCLSSLDELITAQSQKLDALKIHKKGLMQQLFPVLDDEVQR
jgi:type I restriction enzyme S subunit